jgi:undecaprenyl diphosphate synthase
MKIIIDGKTHHLKKFPVHVGVIMDGNGRWAKRRGLPRTAGHRAGMKAVKTIVNASGAIGIKYLTLYAFSVENWLRPKPEVTVLMHLLREYLHSEIHELDAKRVRIITTGRTADLEANARAILLESIERTRHNTGLVLNLALSYGGKAEIVDAVKGMAHDLFSHRLRPDRIDETVVQRYLYHPEVPDADLIIRTSGENRLSNFLLWQGAYAEFYTTETLWPDFGETDLQRALLDYQNRDRRFGKIN